MKCSLLLFVPLAIVQALPALQFAITRNGIVKGHDAVNKSSVWEYLGVPYAKSPVGVRRFAPPQKPGLADLTLLYEASKWPNDCPQTASKPVVYPLATPQELRIVANFANQNGNPQSEDCLYLNIWTKKTIRTNKPVIVFFYGGRYSIGATNSPFYNGQYLADSQDVVVVTVNFRLNIFGFHGAPGTSQNLGLQDQRMAVEYVRDNIEAFGGDPRKIVLMGQSSGSVAVDFWSYAYVKDPIVSGIISHSGNVFSFPINTPELSYKNWYNASALLGCGSTGDVMACMRSKPFANISAAAAKVLPPPSSSQARSQPVFQPMTDGVTVFNDYYARSTAGKFANIPYMLGHGDNEAGYYKIAAFGQGRVLSDEAWDEFNRACFTCANSLEAKNRAKIGVPTFLFRYFGDWDNLRLYPTSGTYHGSDVNMVFGGSADVSGLPNSANETKIIALFQKAWATFAQDPLNGLTNNMKWPRYVPERNTLIAIAQNNTPSALLVSPSLFDSNCSSFQATYQAT